MTAWALDWGCRQRPAAQESCGRRSVTRTPVEGRSVARRGALEGGDVELLHSQEGLRHTLDLLPIGVEQQLRKHAGNDLPGQPELVFQPATGGVVNGPCAPAPARAA
jgi:hypothetical protein